MSKPIKIWPFNNEISGISLFTSNLGNDVNPLFDDYLKKFQWIRTVSLKRRSEFLAGRSCAEEALKELGSADTFVSIVEPYRYPLIPSGFVGSISHTEDRAISCIARSSLYESVGIDIEKVSYEIEINEMASHIMTSNELSKFKTMNTYNSVIFFYLCFSAKEAFFKSIFPITHIFMDFFESELLWWNLNGDFLLRLKSNRISEYFKNNEVFKGFWAFDKGYVTTLIVNLK